MASHVSPRIRDAAVAGAFYPAGRTTLLAQISEYLSEASTLDRHPKALIVPHAGYIYSGPVAASAYRTLSSLEDQITKVVLLGPAHRVYVRGLAASTATAFRTPVGDIPIDQSTIEQLSHRHRFFHYLDAAHLQEHCLEVQLPFLQVQLNHFSLVPILVGEATYDEVASVLKELWGGPETLIVISSDLSHYHGYREAQRMDADTSAAIESMAPERIGVDRACGRIPIGGLLLAAREKALKVEQVDLRNSGDTAGPRDRVVGYGAYLVY